MAEKSQSARGLFKATGNRVKPKPQLNLDGTFELTDKPERAAHDFPGPTPPEPTRAFLAVELENILRLGNAVWESSCGDGAIVRELQAVGLEVFASDLVDRGCFGATIADFYGFKDWPLAGSSRIFIGNPPYNETNARDGQARWLWHCLQHWSADYVAFLLPWPFPGAAGLDKFWAAFPPARIYLLTWKVDFSGEGSPPMLNAWFCWVKSHTGPTEFYRLGRADARQGELL